jgi:predicted thioredoxin/glutaredoxin
MKTVELYYSDTCSDCRYIRRIILEALPKNAMFKEVNISYPEGKRKAESLGILSVPALVIDGEVVIIGRTSKEEILRELGKWT